MMRNLSIFAVLALLAVLAIAQDQPAPPKSPCVVWAQETPQPGRQHAGRNARPGRPQKSTNASPDPDDVLKLAKRMDDPVEAEILAIAKIKALAAQIDDAEPIVDILHHLREQSAHPQVQRLALFAIADILENNGQPLEAAETLARVAEVRDACGPPRGRCPRGMMSAPPHRRGRMRNEDGPGSDPYGSGKGQMRRQHGDGEDEDDEDERDEEDSRPRRRYRERGDDDARLDVPTPDLALSDEELLRLLDLSQRMLDDLRQDRVAP
jgi:hypothetical protein